jgi:hypothetical protein
MLSGDHLAHDHSHAEDVDLRGDASLSEDEEAPSHRQVTEPVGITFSVHLAAVRTSGAA